MSTWIRLLPLELDSMDEAELIEPDNEVKDGEVVVGEMSSVCKRLFVLANLYQKQSEQFNLDSRYCTGDEKTQLEAKANEFGAKTSLLRTALWISIRDELELWNDQIGVRVGFKVVSRSEDDAPPDISDFFRHMFGGGQ